MKQVTSKTKFLYGWHITDVTSTNEMRLSYNGRPIVKQGEWVDMNGGPGDRMPRVCVRGMHGCFFPVRCLSYRVDGILTFCQFEGPFSIERRDHVDPRTGSMVVPSALLSDPLTPPEVDKFAALRRKVLWRAPSVELVLRMVDRKHAVLGCSPHSARRRYDLDRAISSVVRKAIRHEHKAGAISASLLKRMEKHL